MTLRRDTGKVVQLIGRGTADVLRDVVGHLLTALRILALVVGVAMVLIGLLSVAYWWVNQ